jgi:hypothetical protein
MQNYSFILPAGTYVITDPCYVIDRWDQVITDTDCFETTGVHKLDGHVYCGIGTAYGDGCYRDNRGNEYPVDAGLIGAVAIDLVKLEGKDPDQKTVAFANDVECGYADGVIFFGHIHIQTSFDDEDNCDSGEDDCFYDED